MGYSHIVDNPHYIAIISKGIPAYLSSIDQPQQGFQPLIPLMDPKFSNVEGSFDTWNRDFVGDPNKTRGFQSGVDMVLKTLSSFDAQTTFWKSIKKWVQFPWNMMRPEQTSQFQPGWLYTGVTHINLG